MIRGTFLHVDVLSTLYRTLDRLVAPFDEIGATGGISLPVGVIVETVTGLRNQRPGIPFPHSPKTNQLLVKFL